MPRDRPNTYQMHACKIYVEHAGRRRRDVAENDRKLITDVLAKAEDHTPVLRVGQASYVQRRRGLFDVEGGKQKPFAKKLCHLGRWFANVTPNTIAFINKVKTARIVPDPPSWKDEDQRE
jgi:hypothetical protein